MNVILLVLAMNLPGWNAPQASVMAGRSPRLTQAVNEAFRQDDPHADAWFAQDKLKHAFMSMAVVGFAHAGARTVGFENSAAVVVGVSGSALAGLWKEWRDRRMGGPFSYRDLVWDALGIVTGALIAENARE